MEEYSIESPFSVFRYCPRCGSEQFVVNNFKSKKCIACGFVYYFNPYSAVACFITDGMGNILVARRKNDPAKGTLDLPGGFVDNDETPEQAAEREIREETGLVLAQTVLSPGCSPMSRAGEGNAAVLRYLFSLPNTYLYSGLDIRTVDMFFECRLGGLQSAVAADDVAELLVVPITDLDPSQFGLSSIKKGVEIYRKRYLAIPE